jgi:hypothetical protein
MSELELVLRHRLEQVRKGVIVGTEPLQAAQDATGLSNERLARELHVSSKTWERWKKAGEVPSYYIDEIARVLRLEIERPTQRPLASPDGPAIADHQAELLAGVSTLLESSREALPLLRSLDERLSRLEASLLPAGEVRQIRRKRTRTG